MKRAAIVLSIAAIFLWTCSKKSSEPEGTPVIRLTFEQILDFQIEQGQLFDSLLTELDTLNAQEEVLRAVQSRQDIVKQAIPNSQGIAILYIDSSRGGIMIDPEDFAAVTADSIGESGSPNRSPCAASDIPKSRKTAFLCPIYSSRREYADVILSSIESAVRNTGFDNPESYLDDSCGLGRFADLTQYGLVHIYSHGFAWPSKDLIDNVYLMTGEHATNVIEQSYSRDIEVGSTIPVYVSGEGNKMFISPGFISTRNVFADDIPIFYLGFGYSIRGTWQRALTMVSRVGVCIGYSWRIFANRNVDWACQFYSTMSDTTRYVHASIWDWYDSIDKFYIDEYETTPPLPHRTYIDFNGLPEISLWTFRRALWLDSVTPSVGHPQTVVKLRGIGFGTSSDSGKVTFGGVEVTARSWSDTLIVFDIPRWAESGDIIVEVGELISNPVAFWVFWVTDIQPGWGGAGTPVSIYGVGFGTEIGEVVFEGDNASGEVTDWTDTLIRVLVPENAVRGFIRVFTNGEMAYKNVYFNVMRIDWLIPDTGLPGDTISIIGTNFFDYKIADSVMFGDDLGTITYWSDTLVNVRVPQITSSCEVMLHVKSNVSNRVEFTLFGMTDL